MKSLLAKISLRKFVGLYLGEHEVSASYVAVTPLGPVEIAARTEPCPPNELLSVIEHMLQSLQGRKQHRLQVAIGLPNARVFFGTRPLRGGADSSPEGVMQKLLCSANISIADLTIDLIKSTVDKSPLASVAACRKKYMAAVLGVLQRCGARAVRAEPAPYALVRAAARQHRPPRRAGTLLRIFLGAQEGLAVLTVGGLPLAWRTFATPPLSEGMAILSAARTLLSQSQYHGIAAPLDYVVIHGRPDLHERLQKEGLPTEMGARMMWHDGPELSGATMAFGLALGCASQSVRAFDLSRNMKPRASLREIFPWGELVGECVLVALMGLMLAHHSEKTYEEYSKAKIECDGNRILALSDMAALEKEKKDLTTKLTSLHKFLDSRITWTSCTRAIADCLPSTIELKKWQGNNNTMGGGKTSAKSVQLLATVLTSDGMMPPEVAKFVAALRRHPVMKEDFPQIELQGLKQGRAGKSTNKDKDPGATVGFTINCQAGKGKGAK